MEDTKTATYYTPELEGWAEFTPDMLIGEGRVIRVKYLDKEDIESLGFKWQKYIPGPTELLCNSEEKQVFIKANTRLILFTNRIAIECFPIGGKMYKTVFEGICKNKSKLKSLLKRCRSIMKPKDLNNRIQELRHWNNSSPWYKETVTDIIQTKNQIPKIIGDYNK